MCIYHSDDERALRMMAAEKQLDLRWLDKAQALTSNSDTLDKLAAELTGMEVD